MPSATIARAITRPDGGAGDAGGLHANGPVPVSHTITATTAIAVQTASW